MSRPIILFLGPCPKLQPCRTKVYAPFAETSRSGRFLRLALQQAAVTERADTRFDNVLQGPCLTSDGREVNPPWDDMVTPARSHALWRLGPRDVVVGLSTDVGKALAAASNLRGQLGEVGSPRIIAMQHPSYVMRRPFAERELYVFNLRSIFKTNV